MILAVLEIGIPETRQIAEVVGEVVGSTGFRRAADHLGELTELADHLDFFGQAKLRGIQILRSGITIPAPSRDGAAEGLADITTKLDATYSTGKFIFQGREIDLLEASRIIQESRNPAELQAVWEGWHSIAAPMAPDYTRMVEIANEGARELGYPSLDQMWLSNYDMQPAQMEAEVQRLWTQVEPLYKELHCYARGRLNTYYGDAVQPATGPIRADLLGNMWAQQWSGVYDILKTDTPGPSYDLSARLNEKGYTPLQMVQTAEAFFTSLGLQELPETFWERSMITKPEGREVVCHASAWDLDDYEDVRIKMCTQVNAEDFNTVHHELGPKGLLAAGPRQARLGDRRLLAAGDRLRPQPAATGLPERAGGAPGRP